LSETLCVYKVRSRLT